MEFDTNAADLGIKPRFLHVDNVQSPKLVQTLQNIVSDEFIYLDKCSYNLIRFFNILVAAYFLRPPCRLYIQHGGVVLNPVQ